MVNKDYQFCVKIPTHSSVTTVIWETHSNI